jgi:F0F1-type ATP synthase gamma subunit
MANMKQIKAKIKATASIKKTTRALEIVSTIKLQKLKQKTISYRNYLKELLGIMDILEDKK